MLTWRGSRCVIHARNATHERTAKLCPELTQEAGLITACVPAPGSGGLPITARVELVHGYVAHLARALVERSDAEHSAAAHAVALDFYARMQSRIVRGARGRAAAAPPPGRAARTPDLRAAHCFAVAGAAALRQRCLLYTSPSPRDRTRSRMPSSA